MAKTLSSVAKGSVVVSRTPWMLVSLGASKSEPFSSEATRLPRYDTIIMNPGGLSSINGEEEALQSFFIRILRSPSMPVYILVATIRILLSKVEASNEACSQKIPSSRRINETFWHKDEERELAYEGWVFVQHLASWDRFIDLYLHVRQQMHLTSIPHPLTEYITKVFPLLGSSERDVAVHLLRQRVHKKFAHASALRLAHAVLDTYQQKPCMYAVLLKSPSVSHSLSTVRHSCLPNAAWDVSVDDENESAKVLLVALYELEAGGDLSVAMVDISQPYKERTAALVERFGQSDGNPCDCCRCRYECDGSLPHSRDLQRMGHLYFQQGRYEEAQRLYRIALEKDVNLPDIWHALGAVYLQQQHFCQAQRQWKEAAERHTFLKRHKGIALQLEKQIAYRYWDSHTHGSEMVQLPEYVDLFRSLCFATKDPIMSADDCRRVIAWAEDASGGWTTSRHYAVPTTDVPVHEVPALLKWFMECMESKIGPLLSKQFSCPDRKRWYVHDAFVVRYDAFQQNNHLPIHLDESTHSFVLALNDGYEGGGTYFEELDKPIHVSEGNMVSFRGDTLRHGGNIVTSGIRYVLAVFLYLDDGPDFASTPESSQSQKRCKLQHIFQDKKKNEEEKPSFSFGFDFYSKK